MTVVRDEFFHILNDLHIVVSGDNHGSGQHSVKQFGNGKIRLAG